MLSLDERLEFLRRGNTCQENELAWMRACDCEKGEQGAPRTTGECHHDLAAPGSGAGGAQDGTPGDAAQTGIDHAWREQFLCRLRR